MIANAARVAYSPYADFDGQAPVTSSGIVADIPAEPQIERRLAELAPYRGFAYRDALTGLWNRRMFEERLAAEIERPSERALRRFSMLLVDLDDLGRINQRHGHAEGDRVLARTAAFLVANLRPDDVCCRIGGDEFAAVLPDAGAMDAQALVAHLRGALATANRRAAPAAWLSFGTATFPSDARNGSGLVRRADAEMYDDKARGKEATPRDF